MYLQFYGFEKKPFQVTCDPDYFYRSQQHNYALTYLEYGLNENVGFMVLSGEVGSGKTTTVQYLLNQLDGIFNIALIKNTNITPKQFLREVYQQYGFKSRNKDKNEIFNSLNKYLYEQARENKRFLLVVDEAQNLKSETMEEVRMLSNQQKNSDPLLQILLVGQPELVRILKKEEMKQFAQRVAVHYHLSALAMPETEKYIAYRLKAAGGDPGLFTPASAERIHELSGGIPRLINLLCQAALVYGYADGSQSISQDVIHQIQDDKLVIGLDSQQKEVSCSVEDDHTISITTELKNKVMALEVEVDALHTRVNKMAGLNRNEFEVGYMRQIEKLTESLRQEVAKNAEITHAYQMLKRKVSGLKKYAPEEKIR